MRPLVALVAVSLGIAECGRVPAEDFRKPSPVATDAPQPASAASWAPTDPAQASLSGRCVALTPRKAPDPVPQGPAPGCPVDPEAHPVRAAAFHTTFSEASGVAVEAELVRTEHDTTRGLMYRTKMSEDSGMLFDLHPRAEHKFWMHNTCIPLDMLFVDEDGLIVGIVENAPTLNDDARTVGCPSRWVLEVNAGWSRRHGIKAGEHMSLP